MAAAKLFDFTEDNGLIPCNDIGKAKNNSEIIHLSEAQKLGADAVFFRRFLREGSEKISHSEPAVYLFKKNKDFFNSPAHVKLHADIWSAGKSEVYIIISKTNLHIINSRKPAQLNSEAKLSIEDLVLASSEAVDRFNDHRFSSHLFATGTFWDQGDFYSNQNPIFSKNKLEEENMPYHQLLAFLKQTRGVLQKTELGDLTSEIVDKLLIICILIKFLEEIKNPDGSHTLTKIYQKYKINNFSEALMQKGLSIDILEELGKKLNGKIFDYFTDQEVCEAEGDFNERNNKIKSKLRDVDLSPIANLLLVRLNKQTGELEFDILSHQLKLDFDFSWQQYSFRHLPIELISSIYEHFLQEDALEQDGEREKGVVYTPPYLVNFLIDDVMPLDAPELLSDNKYTVLDPSCGSGVFLVGAYKRILQWWIINYYQLNGRLPEKFEPHIFQQLLERNIFGVDINKKATLITIFSLTIAFLDKLDPIAFWNNLNFRKLRNNIKTVNFFEWAANIDEDFDLIIGNPPFNLPTEYKKKKDEYFANFVTPYYDQIKDKQVVPEKSLALYFLEFAVNLSSGNTICLIIPSTTLLYSPKLTAIRYRIELFKRYNVQRIFDFTHLRRILFKRLGKVSTKDTDAEPSVCSVIIEKNELNKKGIHHVVLKRMNVIDKKIRFELDHYDYHFVKNDWACDECKQFIWKTNLLGGGRLFHLVNRLKMLENLKGFVAAQNEQEPGWLWQKGYLAGTPPKKAKIISHLYKQQIVTVESEKIVKQGVEEGMYFERPRPPELFQPPLLLIHLKVGYAKLPIAIQEKSRHDFLVFNSSHCGIHAPKNKYQILYGIYERLKKHADTYLLWILTNSSSALVGQETAINKEDIDTLPFPELEREKYLELSKDEKIIRGDVLKFYRHLGKSINYGDDGYVLQRKAQKPEVETYSNIFTRVLNEIYERDGKSWQTGEVISTPKFIICQFGFGKTGGLAFAYKESDLDIQLARLVEDEISNRGGVFKRVTRIDKHINGYDCVIFIKPHAHRYWLGSIALRDADETFIALKNEGY